MRLHAFYTLPIELQGRFETPKEMMPFYWEKDHKEENKLEVPNWEELEKGSK